VIEEELVRPPGSVDSFLIDEIGKMECHYPQFEATMGTQLGGSIPVVATIALRGGGFIAEVKKRPDMQVVEVTQANRQSRSGQIAAWVKQRTARANTP
jgi:nucleoside-triphosphatase